MKLLIDRLKESQNSGSPLALARVIKTWGSSPRQVGSYMIIDENGNMTGSVSGGCVEGEVVKEASATLRDGKGKLLAYGVSDEEAWSVGLSCGGSIQVYLQTINAPGEGNGVWDNLVETLISNKSSTLVTQLVDGQSKNSLIIRDRIIGDDMPSSVVEEAKRLNRNRSHGVYELQDVSYFIHQFPRKSLLLIVGAAHITVDLVSLGKEFGFEVVVIDPREAFADRTRFDVQPDKIENMYPSEVLHQYPLDAHTYCAILSHDPKIDDNALEILLSSEVAYIGALGSKKTHTKRIARLSEAGIEQGKIDKIYSPIGISIQAKSAKEIALSVMAEIIQVKNSYV